MGNERRLRISIQCTGSDHQAKVAGSIRARVGRLPEVETLDPVVREEFFVALGDAAMFALAGFPTGRSDIKGDRWIRMILMSDVKRAMARAGLATAHWRQETTCRDAVGGESIYYTIARLVAEAAGIFMPLDAFRLSKRAKTVRRI